MHVFQEKVLKLNKLERVIRRCEFCNKETEQDAFYAFKPDLSVEANTPTNPSRTIKLLAKETKEYSWFIISRCSICSYSYKVTGVPDRKITAKPEDAVPISIKQMEICCDACYYEDYTYSVSTRFVRVGERRIDLCDKHAAEIELETKKKGQKEVERRLESWKGMIKNPWLVSINGKDIVIKADSEKISQVISGIRNNTAEHADRDAVRMLKNLGLVDEKGFINKRVSLTDSGKIAADQILKG